MPQTIRSQAVNRHDKGYHTQRLQTVQDLDKVASYALALNYSGRSSQSRATQGLIHNDCVAVAVVSGEWYFASNARKLTDEDIEAVADELGKKIIYALVKRGSGSMHAEMQVLEEIVESGHSLQDVFVGVSKPCCQKCRKVMDKHGVKYTAWHEDHVVNWEKPDLG